VMKITIRLYGGLKALNEFPKDEKGNIVFESQELLTVAQFIDALNLNEKFFIVVLNGVILNDLAIPLKDGDEISLFPPVGGG